MSSKMITWSRSSVTEAQLLELVREGSLPPLTDEWVIPGDAAAPEPSDNYVVSFIEFHQRGLGTPPH